MQEQTTIQVSYRLPTQLVERLRRVTNSKRWPPPPTQTDVVARGIELMLRQLEKQKAK